MSLNHIVMMGRLARDPELRHTQSGVPVASFTLAVDRDYKDKSTGERATDWIDVVAWRGTGEFVSRCFTKGCMAVVEGRLQIRDWTDKEGSPRRTAEVVAGSVYFGGPRRDGGQQGGSQRDGQQGGGSQGGGQQGGQGSGGQQGDSQRDGQQGSGQQGGGQQGGVRFSELEDGGGALPF